MSVANSAQAEALFRGQVLGARMLGRLFSRGIVEVHDQQGVIEHEVYLFRRDNGEVVRADRADGEEINRRRDELLGAGFRFLVWPNMHPQSRPVNADGSPRQERL